MFLCVHRTWKEVSDMALTGVKISNLIGHLRQQPALYGLTVCRHVLPDLAAYLEAQGGNFLAFPAGAGSGVLMVIATVPPCREGECQADHALAGAEAVQFLKNAMASPRGAGRLRFSRAWGKLFKVPSKVRA
jgi:hypothetical protein